MTEYYYARLEKNMSFEYDYTIEEVKYVDLYTAAAMCGRNKNSFKSLMRGIEKGVELSKNNDIIPYVRKGRKILFQKDKLPEFKQLLDDMNKERQ